MKKLFQGVIAVLICFIFLLSFVTYPLEASKYACDKGFVKCSIAALLSGELMGGVELFCLVGYAICEQYY